MKKKTLIETILDVITILTITVTVLFALVGISFNAVYISTSVRGYSMYPYLNSKAPNMDTDGDVVFINKYADFENGDVVVANVTWWNKGPIVKRCIASPGDFVQIKEASETYELYVNKKLVYSKEKTNVSVHGDIGGTEAYYEDYTNFLTNPEFQENVVTINGEKYIVMLENQYFLLGDNWGESTDCMTYGPVERNRIVGKVDIIVEYGKDPTWAMVGEMVKLTFVPNWL